MQPLTLGVGGGRAETSQMTTEPRPALTTQVGAESRGGKPLLAAR